MRRSAPARLLTVAVGVLLCASSCGQILNVDGIRIGEPPPSLPDAADAGPSSGAPGCVADQLRCEGVALQVCQADVGVFRTARICSTPELCCDGPHCGPIQGCLPPVCALGDFRCDGATLSICNDAQTGWTAIDDCTTASHCNARQGRCTEEPCDSVARERQCNGADLEQCQPAGWRVVDTCATPSLCSANGGAACEQTRCVIDGNQRIPFQCTYGDLMRCNDAQTGFEHVETCLNAARCNPLIDELTGDPYAPVIQARELLQLGCQAANCTPGRYRCEDDGALVRCNADLTAYLDPVDSCASAAHCNAVLGRCDPVPCTVNATQCSGDEFQRCTGTGWETTSTCGGSPCDHLRGCTAPVCRATQHRCDGRELQRCNADLTGWIPVRSCDTEALCNVAAKRCDPPICVAGQRRCSRDGELQECSPGRDAWLTLEDCRERAGVPDGVSAAALCDPTGSGRCVSQASCAAGAFRCNSQFLERCRGDAWVPHQRCATAALCDASAPACQAPACQPGTFQCVAASGDSAEPAASGAPTRGLVLQRCNAGGTGYEVHEPCSAEEFCDAVHGQCDICDAAAPTFCNGNELSICTADGQERLVQRVCPNGCGTLQPSGPPACLGEAQTLTP